MIRTIPIERAAALLHGVLPDEAPNWQKKIFDPDYIVERARTLGAGVKSVRLENWENIEDGELVDLLLDEVPLGAHEYIVITDICLGACPPGAPVVAGAFVEAGNKLRGFIDEYRATISSHFVDGDLIVACPAERDIRVFHHEGLIVYLRLPG